MRKIATTSSSSKPVGPVIAAPLGRRRRPSGEPPPLPRHVATSTRWLLVGIVVAALLEIALAVHQSRSLITQVDDAVVRALAHLRSQPVTAVMPVFEHLGSSVGRRLPCWSSRVGCATCWATSPCFLSWFSRATRSRCYKAECVPPGWKSSAPGADTPTHRLRSPSSPRLRSGRCTQPCQVVDGATRVLGWSEPPWPRYVSPDSYLV